MTFRKACILTTLLLSIVLPIYVSPASGINLTSINFLFDITHGFSQPSDVAVSKEGVIYVVDGVNNCVKAFNPKGAFIFSFGKKGSQSGRFMNPLGVAVDNTGRVYIADSGNRRIQIFDSKGKFISKFKVSSKGKKPADPSDIAVDELRNRCYVVDNDNHNVVVYDLSTHAQLKTYGTPGAEKREFKYPFLITLDKDGYLYIVDVINTRLQVLSPEGKFVAIIGGWGVEKGQFFRPKGAAIDKKGRVYVSDSYMGVIQVFQQTGEFHSALGDPAKGIVKKFKTPTGLFIDGNSRLYVVEMFADKVSVYSINDYSKDQ
jgi:DNA-binding beta-propeller fold protein YncE